MTTSNQISAETEFKFSRAKFDIAFFADIVVAQQTTPNWLAQVRRMGPAPDATHRFTFTMGPRQTGMTTAMAVAIAHRLLFTPDDVRIGATVGTPHIQYNLKQLVEGMLRKFLTVLFGEYPEAGYIRDLMRRLRINTGRNLMFLRGMNIDHLFIDNAALSLGKNLAEFESDVLPIFKAKKSGRIHIIQTGYDPIFSDPVFDGFEKYHNIGKQNEMFKQQAAMMGEDAAIREVLCLHPNAIVPAGTYLKAI